MNCRFNPTRDDPPEDERECVLVGPRPAAYPFGAMLVVEEEMINIRPVGGQACHSGKVDYVIDWPCKKLTAGIIPCTALWLSRNIILDIDTKSLSWRGFSSSRSR